MEGNDCYKFSTICNYLLQTGSRPIKVAVDCGANVGNITSLIRRYFPDSQIYAFEPVQAYFEATRDRFSGDARVKVLNHAVTYLHLYSDDLGNERRPTEDPLAVFLARTDTCGPNAIGGSVIGSSVDESRDPSMYTRLPDPVSKITFDELTRYVLADSGESEVDYVKFDCEGCEWSCLGCVSAETLRKIRFISGEYHNIARFNRAMAKTLMRTHRVNLIGKRDLGAFFCERIDTFPGILNERDVGMFQVRPWLSDDIIGWEPFKEDYVLAHERAIHQLE
jgi:hypothetical protein